VDLQLTSQDRSGDARRNIEGIREASAERISADKAAIMHCATEELRASGIMDRVIKTGDPLPPFSLPNAYGREVRSADFLANRPWF
jgi:hypothetical protein